MATAASHPRSDPHRLFDLPDELLVQVVSHLAHDKQALCTLARTCRFLQVESEKHIYTTIELLSTNDLHAIIEAFTRRPERIASVATLKILYRFHDGLGATADERSVFNRCIAGMKALREWHIESPYDNFKWNQGGAEWVTRDMEVFRRALETASLQETQQRILSAPPDVGLTQLERLVIHTHGRSDDFWNLGSFHCLFRHPCLRYLHVSCLVLPPDLPELGPYANSTPLTELVFDECELEPKSLGMILATPKKLKHLTLGENVYNTSTGRSVNPRLTRAPEAALAALKHVAHSLESLTHHDPSSRLNTNSQRLNPVPGDGMRHFHSLVLLRTDACSFLHRSIVLSHTQAPPNLATLLIRHLRPRLSRYMPDMSHEDFFEHLPPYEPYTYLTSLKTLEFIQGATPDMRISKPEHICETENVRARHAYAYKLFKHGINLRVTLQASWSASLIPPYLHGEVTPQLLCVYDASEVGFRRRVLSDKDEARPLAPFHHGFNHVSMFAEEQDAPPETETETDWLNTEDIVALRFKVRRSLNALWDRMEAGAGDDISDGEATLFTITTAVWNTGEDSDWTDNDDDDDDDLFVDMDAGEWEDLDEFDGQYNGLDMDVDLD